MLKRIDGSTLDPQGLAPNALQMFFANTGSAMDQYTPSVDCLGFNTLHLTIRASSIREQNGITLEIYCFNGNDLFNGESTFFDINTNHTHRIIPLPHANVVLRLRAKPAQGQEIRVTSTLKNTAQAPTVEVINAFRPSYYYAHLGNGVQTFESIELDTFQDVFAKTYTGVNLQGYYLLQYHLVYAVDSSNRRSYRLAITDDGRGYSDDDAFSGFTVVMPKTGQVRFGTQTSQPLSTDYFVYNHVYANWIILGKPSEVLVLRGRIRRDPSPPDQGGNNEGLRLDAFNVSLTPIEGGPENFYSRV
jgi:hypothetical protein